MTYIQRAARVRNSASSRPTTDHPSRHPRPARPPVTGPLFDVRFRRHVDHLCRLGPRPVAECFLQLVGNQDDARTALIVLLEQYQRLDADVVAALGGDRWPETVFAVGPT